MCQFLSWIEYKGKLYYFSDYEVNSSDGRRLCRSLGNIFHEEIKGHGVIREYFGLSYKQGKNYECEDFSTPDNFPIELVEKIKKGKFSQIGVSEQLLKQPALAEYEKIRQSAWAEYKKIEQPAWAEYEKIRQPALAEYEKIEQPALAEYKKIRQPALAEYEKIEQPALAEYEKIEQPAWAEYEKIRQSALAEYEKIEQPAWAEYKKIRQPAWTKYEKIERSIFWELFSDINNRNELWI